MKYKERVFPLRGDTDYGATGLTLRDHFAAQAIISAAVHVDPGYDWSKLAETAYKIADAILEARSHDPA
jgi:hypothetical protein